MLQLFQFKHIAWWELKFVCDASGIKFLKKSRGGLFRNRKLFNSLSASMIMQYRFSFPNATPNNGNYLTIGNKKLESDVRAKKVFWNSQHAFVNAIWNLNRFQLFFPHWLSNMCARLAESFSNEIFYHQSPII